MEWLSDWSTWWKILAAIGTGLGLFPTPKRSVMVKFGRFLLWHLDREGMLFRQALRIKTLEESNRQWARDYALTVTERKEENERVLFIASLAESAVSSLASDQPQTSIPTRSERKPEPFAASSTAISG